MRSGYTVSANSFPIYRFYCGCVARCIRGRRTERLVVQNAVNEVLHFGFKKPAAWKFVTMRESAEEVYLKLIPGKAGGEMSITAGPLAFDGSLEPPTYDPPEKNYRKIRFQLPDFDGVEWRPSGKVDLPHLFILYDDEIEIRISGKHTNARIRKRFETIVRSFHHVGTIKPVEIRLRGSSETIAPVENDHATP